MSIARNQIKERANSDVSGDEDDAGLIHDLPSLLDAQAKDGGIHPFKRVEVDDADYTVQLEDSLIVLTALTSSRIITLPAAADVPAGKVFTIKDESGNAAADPAINIATPGTEEIDGSASDSIETAYGVRRLYSDRDGEDFYST